MPDLIQAIHSVGAGGFLAFAFIAALAILKLAEGAIGVIGKALDLGPKVLTIGHGVIDLLERFDDYRAKRTRRRERRD